MVIINSRIKKQIMKSKILIQKIVLFGLLLVVFNACKKTTGYELTDDEANRSYMAVFRHRGNTGKSGAPIGCQVVNTNDM